MATLYLAFHLFGLWLGIPVGTYSQADCARMVETAPFVLVCINENGAINP